MLLQRAEIVVLDEATSQLDGATQTQVSEAMGALAAERTVLLIAHRLETVRHADQIVVLAGGRVVERGTHDELLAAGGEYAAMLAQPSLR